MSFSLTAHNLSFLVDFTTPARVPLDVQLSPGAAGQDDASILYGFLARCTSTLESITLNTQSQETFIAEVLPHLGRRKNLVHLRLDIWPSNRALHAELEESWLPDLQGLSVTIESSKHLLRSAPLELERMKGLGDWLLRRKEAGREPLKRLTVHKRSAYIDFPYKLFEDVALGHLLVMVPW
jgi:hypothetical protein